jgi:hypothetical protein
MKFETKLKMRVNITIRESVTNSDETSAKSR